MRIPTTQNGVAGFDRAPGSEELGLLVDRLGARAYGLAIRILGEPAAADEVVRDCFLMLWQRSEHRTGDVDSFDSSLLTLVRNRTLMRLRQRDSRSRHGRAISVPEDSYQRPEAPPSAPQLIRKAFARLPFEQRQVLEQVYFEGRSVSDVAKMLGVPRGTISKRITLALRHLIPPPPTGPPGAVSAAPLPPRQPEG